MSYVKVQSMTIKKDGIIRVRAADSNVSPVRYISEDLKFQEGLNMVQKLETIFDLLVGGAYQFNQSSKSYIFYAYLKTMHFLNDKYQLPISSIYFSNDDEGNIVIPETNNMTRDELHKEAFNEFCSHLMGGSKVALNKREYQVILSDGGYLDSVINIHRGSYRYSYGETKGFVINQALLYSYRFKGTISKTTIGKQ